MPHDPTTESPALAAVRVAREAHDVACSAYEAALDAAIRSLPLEEDDDAEEREETLRVIHKHSATYGEAVAQLETMLDCAVPEFYETL